MNKAELLQAVTKRTALRPSYVQKVVDAIFDPESGVIAKQVSKGSRVTIAGFGTFERRRHKGRTVSSPLTGTTVAVKARNLPGFRAGTTFKQAMR